MTVLLLGETSYSNKQNTLRDWREGGSIVIFKVAIVFLFVFFSLSDAIARTGEEFKKAMEECKKVEKDLDPMNAIKSCTKAININPNNADAFFFRGLAYIYLFKQKGDESDNAISDFTTYINQKPSDKRLLSIAHNNRGYAYFLKGKYVTAIEDYKTALELYPDNNLARNNLKIAEKYIKADEKIGQYSEKIKNNPYEFEIYRAAVEAFVEKEEYTKAIEILDTFISKVQTNAKAFLLRGWCKAKKGMKEEALKDYTQAIKINPQYPNSYYWRAQVYSIEENDKKIIDLKKALELDPKFTDAMWSLGWALDYKIMGTSGYERQQTLKEAIGIFSRLIEIDSEYDSRIYRFRARWSLLLNPPDCETAIADNRKAIELGKDTDTEYGFLAETLVECRKFADAIRTYEDILSRKETFFKFKEKASYAVELGKTWILWGGINVTNLTSHNVYNFEKGLIKKGIDVLSDAIKMVPSHCKKLEISINPYMVLIDHLEDKLRRKHEVLSELMEEHIKLKKSLGGL